MATGFKRARRAVAPVIAAVIMLAVGITISVAIAFWISGIAEQQAKFEKIEIQSSACTWNATGTYWKIQLKAKNTGTTTSTLINAFVNDAEIQNYDVDGVVAGETSTNMTTSMSVSSGASVVVNVYISQGYISLTVGTTVSVELHSAFGIDYPILVQLS